MKRRYILYRRKRGGMFYIEDTETRKQESTGTRNRAEATSLLNARNESIRQPHLNLQIAKAYLAGTDSGVATRTWQQALESIIETKSGPTQDRWRQAAKQAALDLIRHRVILETQAEHLLACLNAERIFPYLGGDETNESPSHAHYRYVISFADFPLRRSDLGATWADASDSRRENWISSGVVPLDYPGPVAADWPDLLRIVEEKVKPERVRKKPNGDFVLRDPLPQRWWHYADKRPALYSKLRSVSSVIVRSLTSKHIEAFAVLQTTAPRIFDQTLIVFPINPSWGTAILNCRVHDAWAKFFGPTLEDRPRYTPSDCFETFPFPVGFETNVTLEAAGREYYEFRAALMVRNNEGLTKTYNRFHDPEESSPDIIKLRELHAKMDAAVLAAYGWNDLIPKCECRFILDYEDEEDDESESTGKRKKKKPYRYRWQDEVRDEVLARLLKLNAERAQQERLSGEAAAAAQPKKSRGKKSSAAPAQGEIIPSPQKDLFA